jgi:hypothetical protein
MDTRAAHARVGQARLTSQADGRYAYWMFRARHHDRHHHHSCFGGPVALHAN